MQINILYHRNYNSIKSLTKSFPTFSELMRKASEQRRQKYKWLYEKEQSLIENGNNDSIKLIEGSDKEKSAENSTWKYKVILYIYISYCGYCIDFGCGILL
jgi:hypothetical protein